MEYNAKKEERKAYFHYFRVWFILFAIAAVAFLVVLATHKGKVEITRQNTVAPSQRVYDYAEVLSKEEENALTKLIAECERRAKCDIILVTINEEMGKDDRTWTYNMVNRADDFYDENQFGYNEPFGDGVLFLDNWYKDEEGSQQGAWLSTSGKMEWIIGESEENTVWDAFDAGLEDSAAKGYEKAIRQIAKLGERGMEKELEPFPWYAVWILPLIVSLIYALVNMKQAPGVDTTDSLTYVAGRKPNLIRREDQFLRKSVSKVKIETESSSGSNRSGGGGSYGHHTSSSGHSHGGGGHRR